MKNKEGRVLRFNLFERLGHWFHAISCIILLITGLALVFRGYGNLFSPKTLSIFSKTHHYIGIVFTFASVITLVLFTPKTFFRWLKDCFDWSSDDIKFVMSFPKEFFGRKVYLPKQGKFNAGEKINSLITIGSFFIMVITGWIMMFPQYFSGRVLLICYPLHAAGALIIGTVLIGHAYLSLLHPNSKESIKGMLWGTVSEKFAREHHALWYEEIKENKTTSECKIGDYSKYHLNE